MRPSIHLVGSVAMPDSESVFRALSSELAPWLRRIPDGETGERHRWIYWQREMLLSHLNMELDPDATPLALYQWDGELIRETELVRFKPDVDPSSVVFETGYAPAAIASYDVFRQLRDDGVIPAGVRFQVCLPTPMASGYMYISPASIEDYLPVYEKALLTALSSILDAISHHDLSIQWDICQEVLIFEDYFPYRPDDYKLQIFDQMTRLGAQVPADVELGYHLCYGTPRDEHLVMPKDTAILVEVANGLASKLQRQLDFLHMPVPRDRVDDAYYAPLAKLKLPPETELYLGLIHHQDHSGDKQRIATAQKVIPSFGIASECGWGRTDPERVPGLIESHRLAASNLYP
ncbi:MAG TPA: hypothetical protein EYM57_16590 [Gammaproteobacteria bacterium]|nr:hypothetical protein [Gammaproteobacteria bacterium]RTZ66273.1 MAG: hypothetical protein DSZ34_01285 [Gammaproteobacteria bacterium]HAD37986.1 hypothetical protein [Gammaproteobacteria bacterium]HBK74982.1 hypothetical protein [Gammaproteobacteria bacterium]HIM87236.1 hypothetical protein [Gammaproteobacteria bacterium]